MVVNVNAVSAWDSCHCSGVVAEPPLALAGVKMICSHMVQHREGTSNHINFRAQKSMTLKTPKKMTKSDVSGSVIHP